MRRRLLIATLVLLAAGGPARGLVGPSGDPVALHGGLLARARGLDGVRPGRLVSLREVALSEEYVDRLDGPLDVYAECLYADDGSAQYVFRVAHPGRPLASGRAAVIHPAA